MKKYPYILNEFTNKKKCLVVYIVEPLLKRGKLTHTNQLEARLMVKCLEQNGYVVDAVDYCDTLTLFRMDWEHYEFVVTIQADFRLELIFRLKRKNTKVIFYATTSAPLFNNSAGIASIRRAENAMKKRTGQDISLVAQRQLPIVSYKRFDKLFAQIDAVWCVGNRTTMATYSPYNVPIERIYITGFHYYTHQDVVRDMGTARKNYLFFGSAGMVHKGLDILIEAFDKRPELTLYVAGPTDDYWTAYKKYIHLPNVRYVGFVNVRSRKYVELCSQCAFTILPSCSEGSATSVTTTMHMGLIPIVSREAGIDVEKHGFIIERHPEDVLRIMQEIDQMPECELERRCDETYEYANRYCAEEAYIKSIQSAINNMNSR